MSICKVVYSILLAFLIIYALFFYQMENAVEVLTLVNMVVNAAVTFYSMSHILRLTKRFDPDKYQVFRRMFRTRVYREELFSTNPVVQKAISEYEELRPWVIADLIIFFITIFFLT